MANTKHNRVLLVFGMSIFFLANNSFGALWNSANNPATLDFQSNYEYRLSELPLSAKLNVTPWAETYWPTNKGSINRRWNTPIKDGFGYTPPTREQVAAMSEAERAQLSPSEKYDIYLGHYDYPIWKEVRQIADPNDGEYSGMCDGWAVASVQYREPKAVTLVNPEGIRIPFGSSDVKGLITYASEAYYDRDRKQVGQRCNGHPTTPSEVAACEDMNPGAMHVILANQIGKLQKGFAVQRQPNGDDWNQPVFAYESKLVGSAVSDAGPGYTAVAVEATLYYTEDLDRSFWEPMGGTPNFKSGKIKMKYSLDLDSQGRIVGGTWAAGSDHPDFMWNAKNPLQFTDEMSGLNSIYQPAN